MKQLFVFFLLLLAAGCDRLLAQPQQQETENIVGRWCMRVDGMIKNPICLYLILNEDGTASLEQKMVWFEGRGDESGSDTPWYIVEGWFKLGSRYEKSGNQLRFTWDPYDKVRLQDFKCYNGCDVSENVFLNKANMLLPQFKEYVRDKLVNSNIDGLTDFQLSLSAGGERLVFTNVENTDEQMVQIEKLKEKEYFFVDNMHRINKFKKYYKDAEVSFNYLGNSVIEWKNGDIYQGSFDIGFIKHNGFLINGVGYGWEDLYEGEEKNPYVTYWLNLPLLEDLELHFIDGTFTTVDGKKQEWRKGHTNDQINGMINNFEKKLEAELSQFKGKCESTRKQLIAEGFNQNQVNALILKGNVLYGTPRSLFKRAKELGCNFSLGPELTVDKRYHAYWVKFSDINTGYTTLAAFVCFHWLWDTVNYVGSSLP